MWKNNNTNIQGIIYKPMVDDPGPLFSLYKLITEVNTNHREFSQLRMSYWKEIVNLRGITQ